jgi:aminoglycoside 6'-N-acetyltransferase
MIIRPFQKDDIFILITWLQQDSIKDYFDRPMVWVTEISKNLEGSDWIKYYIIENDEPVAFVQYYETDRAPHGRWSNEPPYTVGIDFLIGDEKSLNKGLGSSIIKLIINEIESKGRYKYIISDPNENNVASVQLLENNGFSRMPNGLYRFVIADTH